MLAADPRVAYISEPLNVHHRPGVFRARVMHWYTYICTENEAEYLPAFQELLALEYHARAEVASLRSGRDALRMGRDLGVFLIGRLAHRRPLLKDPFAVFSLAWFAERLNCEMVVTIRHPAAFVSSLKRLNWFFDFQDLLEQPLLMRDHLARYREQMQSCAADDVVGQASLLWTIIYQCLDGLRQRLPSLQVVRHEDLSMDPVAGFRWLYEQLGLSFTPSVERAVLASSSSENPIGLPRGRTHSVQLDSRASLDLWKRLLSAEEVARIRGVTEDVVGLYYPGVDWN
jgi:hypothetical protein